MQVTGQLVDSFGLLILAVSSPSDIQRKGNGPLAVEAFATNAIGEATEGRLVQLSVAITQPIGNDLPFGYRIVLDDGSGAVQIGQQIRVIGCSSQIVDQYEVNPRAQADIQLLGS